MFHRLHFWSLQRLSCVVPFLAGQLFMLKPLMLDLNFPGRNSLRENAFKHLLQPAKSNINIVYLFYTMLPNFIETNMPATWQKYDLFHSNYYAVHHITNFQTTYKHALYSLYCKHILDKNSQGVCDWPLVYLIF